MVALVTEKFQLLEVKEPVPSTSFGSWRRDGTLFNSKDLGRLGDFLGNVEISGDSVLAASLEFWLGDGLPELRFHRGQDGVFRCLTFPYVMPLGGWVPNPHIAIVVAPSEDLPRELPINLKVSLSYFCLSRPERDTYETIERLECRWLDEHYEWNKGSIRRRSIPSSPVVSGLPPLLAKDEESGKSG